MATRNLLCELHAHTTWSDGLLGVREVADLYGAAGFDVLAITDHVVRSTDPYLAGGGGRALSEDDFPAYLEEIERVAARARRAWGLLLVPGVELTYEHPDPAESAHAVAVGLRTFVGLEDGLDDALRSARAAGAALIGAHPYTPAAAAASSRGTARFAAEPEWAAAALDRLELCNRHDFFPWVAEARLPAVACGDFHRLEHLATWKTLVPAERDEESVVQVLRSRRPLALTLVEPAAPAAARPRAA
jgi:predicted metal-dependent phosphoesterase TrpH